jgi:hypothetical protein
VVDLYWIPLGAGGHSVRLTGLVYRAFTERELYHAALVVDDHAIEVAPSWDADEASRGVVATGAVGSRLLGRWRLFRYEVRCWRGGTIPDLAEAVGGPRRISSDPGAARRLLDAVARVPSPVWGRDELGAGEMWNSNSVIAWLLATAGLPAERQHPPQNGRAPGWAAGLEIARAEGRPSVHSPVETRKRVYAGGDAAGMGDRAGDAAGRGGQRARRRLRPG